MTTIHPNATWHPISTAPRDGTVVDLTWMEDGQPQEVWPMCWSLFAGAGMKNKGIWVMRSSLSGGVLCTWAEEDPDCAPTHWRARGE